MLYKIGITNRSVKERFNLTDLSKIEIIKQKEYENHPMYGYPNDNKYLSSKAILKDLETLKNILKCYKKSGATKIKLNYD